MLPVHRLEQMGYRITIYPSEQSQHLHNEWRSDCSNEKVRQAMDAALRL
jgi:hypothetical protein